MLRRLRTARDVARLAYRLHGRKTALIDRRGRFTYACLQDRVLRLHAHAVVIAARHGLACRHDLRRPDMLGRPDVEWSYLVLEGA